MSKEVPFSILYHIDFLLVNKKMKEKAIDDNLMEIFRNCQTKQEEEICIQFLDKMTTQRTNIQELKDILANLPPYNPYPKNFYLIRRVIIQKNGTVIPQRERMDQSTRLFRLYEKYIDGFLRVEFIKNPNDQDFEKCKRKIIEKGVTVGGKVFKFLLSSESQIRNGKALFFRKDLGIKKYEIRKSLGDFKGIMDNPFKYLARLGMSLSVSKPTINISNDDFELIDDLKSKQYCFSDGCGKISLEAAKEISKELKLDNLPSAYQIRVQGFKGMVVIDPNAKKKFSFRPSMNKYKADNLNSVDVLNTSCFELGYLNRQLILIFYHLGISKETLLAYQKEEILRLIELQKNPIPDEFENTLISKLVKKSIDNNIKDDIYIHSITHNYVYQKLRVIEKKTAFPIQKSRNAIGVCDEYGILDYGQVFYQCSKLNKVIEGKVVIGKTPALHPGDVRVLDAIYVKELSHIYDCVVFPSKGKRPHCDEIAGMDLDGDLYFISWDENIIPKKVVDPFDYQSISDMKEKKKVNENSIKDIFVKSHSLIDQTGLIFNSHMAFAEQGSLDCKECQDLVLAFKKNVGGAKHGEFVKKEDILNVKEFPHFMFVKPSYQSKGILGTLYDQAENLCDNLYKPKTPTLKIPEDIEKNYQKDEEFEKKLGLLFDQYVYEMRIFVESIDFHSFLDLFEPDSFIVMIFRKYLKEFENLKEIKDKKVFVAQCFNLSYKKAQKIQKQKETMEKDDFYIYLSFAWLSLDL